MVLDCKGVAAEDGKMEVESLLEAHEPATLDAKGDDGDGENTV